MQGPSFPDPIRTPKDLERLKNNVDVNVALKYVFDAITKTRHALQGKMPLIGFTGAPVSRLLQHVVITSHWISLVYHFVLFCFF